MKATVDRNGCIGCGLCAEICPDVFDIADDGLAEASRNLLVLIFTRPTRQLKAVRYKS